MVIFVSAAYETLHDPQKRQVYDRFGEEGLKAENNGGGGSTFHNFHDFFQEFDAFRGGHGGRGHHSGFFDDLFNDGDQQGGFGSFDTFFGGDMFNHRHRGHHDHHRDDFMGHDIFQGGDGFGFDSGFFQDSFSNFHHSESRSSGNAISRYCNLLRFIST